METNDLAKKIEKYYLEHIDELETRYQFHFFTRLYLYTKDLHFKEILLDLKQNYLEYFSITLDKSHEFSKENKRTPFFNYYSKLLKINKCLFHILFMETVFNENYRDFLPKKYDLSEIDITSEKLLLDHKGISVMSTHAMNFLYLYNKFFKQNSDFSIIKKVSTIIEQEYELTEKEDINNLLYLSTHCIINETLFYYKNIESAKLSEAKNLIINTEHLIKDHLDNIKIDGLFEFLICCKFVGHKSKLEKYIFDRAVSQYSSQKGFIKNPHKKTEIGKSEHRNVLFILLFKEFVSA